MTRNRKRTPSPRPKTRLVVEELENRLMPSANVPTHHNDGFNDGHNLNETVLTSDVSSTTLHTSTPMKVLGLAATTTAPTITSANSTVLGALASSFTVTATGSPTPALSESGALPSGVTFVDNGNGTGTLSGTPAAGTGGSYAITFTADNGVGIPATQSFTLTAYEPPNITSAPSTTFTVGTPSSFTETATGFPAPTFSESGALPTGVTFDTTTHALSGTPAVGTGGTYNLVFGAENRSPDGTAQGQAIQRFTLTVNEAPTITSPNNATFTVGTLSTFAVTFTGNPTPIITLGGMALPSGLTFRQSIPGGAFLSGTPAPGTGGTYAITLTATNALGSSPVQNFTLTVNEAPQITSANATSFTVGSAGSFTVTTAPGFPTTTTLTESGALPSGVTFVDNGNGTATLAGTPATGAGNSYSFTITASNAASPNATQSYTLTVNEAPKISSDNDTSFTVGRAGSFTVTTAHDFPTATALTETGALPSGVTFVDNGNGTATLAGTPAAGTVNIYTFTITASNGVAPNATQTFTLTVGLDINAGGGAVGKFVADTNFWLFKVSCG